jgi:hypothetical protein
MDDPTTEQVKAFLRKGCTRSALMVAIIAKLPKSALTILVAGSVGYAPMLSDTLGAVSAYLRCHAQPRCTPEGKGRSVQPLTSNVKRVVGGIDTAAIAPPIPQ